jgi:hypothetical protein
MAEEEKQIGHLTLQGHNVPDHVFCSSFEIKGKATNFQILLAVVVTHVELSCI